MNTAMRYIHAGKARHVSDLDPEGTKKKKRDGKTETHGVAPHPAHSSDTLKNLFRSKNKERKPPSAQDQVRDTTNYYAQSAKNSLPAVVPTKYSHGSPLPLPRLALLQICGTQRNAYMLPTKKSVTVGERMMRIMNVRQRNSVSPEKKISFVPFFHSCETDYMTYIDESGGLRGDDGERRGGRMVFVTWVSASASECLSQAA